MSVTDRYERQIRLFGADGQKRIAEANVAVVGVGGLGSHVCQQLAYLGVTRFVLIDHDDVQATNLNRLIGATEGDIGTPKLDVMERMILSIQASAGVTKIDAKIPDEQCTDALSTVTVIAGCVDNDYARLKLTEIASKAGIPYFDGATDIIGDADGQDLSYGGRVFVSGTAPGCMSCMRELDQDNIRRASMTDAELETEARIYGVPVETLRATGPSVVSLNGAVASVLVTEVMVHLTGLRAPFKHQPYRASLGRIARSIDPAPPNCAYCNDWSKQPPTFNS